MQPEILRLQQRDAAGPSTSAEVQQQPAQLAPLLLNARDAARMLAISERTLWGLTAAGEIACIRFGRAVRYSVDDLRAFVARARSRKAP